MVHEGLVKSLAASLLLATVSACATPDSVKALSAAQLKNTETFCSDLGRTTVALKVYFDRYVSEELQVFDQRSTANRADAEQAVRIKSQTEKWDAAKTAAEVASRMSDIDAKLNEHKDQLRSRAKVVGDGLDHLVDRCSRLKLTHAKLDEYIQLEKANDALNEAAVDNLGIDTKALTQTTDAVIGELTKLEGTAK